jgi:hypothetical protein
MVLLDTFSVHAGIEEEMDSSFFSRFSQKSQCRGVIYTQGCSTRIVGEVVLRKCFSEDEGFFFGVVTDNLVFGEAIDAYIWYIGISQYRSDFFDTVAVGVRF